MSDHDYDVLIFDGYFCDLIVTGMADIPKLGDEVFGTGMGMHAGGAFNSVRALHRLGLKTGWVCDLGQDLFSEFVLSEIRQEGVDTSLLRIHPHPLRSFSLSFSFDHDRGFISYLDPVERYDREPYVLKHRPRCLLLGWLEHGPDVLRLIDAAHQVGARVVMDCQSTKVTLDSPGVGEVLRRVDAFLPNAREARQLTGADDLEQAAEILAQATRVVVIKDGAQGAIAREGECRYHVPPLPVEPVDSTGAGDCFNAGFVYGLLNGECLETCLKLGNICGGVSTTGYGTIATPTLEEVQEWLERLA